MRAMPSPFGRPAVLLAAAIFSTASVQAARHDGLVMYLNFDDEVNPLRNGAANSPLPAPAKVGDALDMRFTAGRFGKAAVFANGPASPSVSDWAIDLGKLESVYAGSFTVAFWAQYDASHPGVIVSNREYGAGSTGGFLMAASGTSAPVGRVLVSGGAQPIIAVPGGGPTAGGKWHHWALVVDRKADSASFYLDGKPVETRLLNGASVKFDTGMSTMIGAAADGRSGARVAVDDVGIWSRALGVQELAALGSAEGKRIPEPATYAFAAGAAGLVAAAVARRRRRV